MDISSIQRKVKASDLSLEKLAVSSSVSDSEKVKELSRAFEAVLLRNILEKAQKPVFESKLTKDSSSSSIYRDLITNQMAENISKSGNLGLAQSFKRQLERQTVGQTAATQSPVSPTATAEAAQSEARSVIPSGKGAGNLVEKPALVSNSIESRLKAEDLARKKL